MLELEPSPPLHNVQCRICLTEECLASVYAIHVAGYIQPCLCAGTSRWIHRQCLDQVRDANRYRPGYTQCLSCSGEYEYEDLDRVQARCPRWTWFVGHMLADVLRLVCVWHMAVMSIGAMLILLDQQRKLVDLLDMEPVVIDSLRGLAAYYLWASIGLLALIGAASLSILAVVSCTGRATIAVGWCAPANPTCLVASVLVLAVVGVIVGLVVAIHWFVARARQHVEDVWCMSEMRQLVVRDLSLQ